MQGEKFVIGGNRSANLSTFMEDASVTNQDPYNKYPEKDGNLVIIGRDWKHIGMVVYPIFKQGHSRSSGREDKRVERIRSGS